MKKLMFFITTLSLLITACNNSNSNTINDNNQNKKTSVMEDLSLTFSGIDFSKAINNAEKHYEVADNHLSIDGVEGTNYFISPDGARFEATAPILLTEIDNSKPFTFTTRLDSPIEKIYDAGTVYIYVDDSNWLKYAFERDEKLRCRVVTVRTEGSSDDNNHDIINQNYVYLRISSNVKQIGFYYSTDGIDWNLARIYRNEYPAKIWLGLSSQSPKEGNNIACFEEMSLTENYISNHRLGE
ncbi:MAG: DUF1349 domain-containing protein [Tannerella sp.]|jgi:regulation of enolase protein 1 (concanavalin A-like superfamily)|nr:DUF1349 domain-containing protein [Tannerella sp.]